MAISIYNLVFGSVLMLIIMAVYLINYLKFLKKSFALSLNRKYKKNTARRLQDTFVQAFRVGCFLACVSVLFLCKIIARF